MAKREYRGPAIDGTMSHLSEVESNTVGGTTSDDWFDENTEWLPDDIDEDDLTPKQRDAVMAYLSHTDRENVAIDELAEDNDFSSKTAWRAINKVFRDLRDFDDLTDNMKLAILIWAHHGFEVNQERLSNRYPVSSRTLGEAKRIFPDLVREKEPISEDFLEKAIEQYKLVHKDDYNRETQETIDESFSGTREQKSRKEKEYPDDFSERQEWFIEEISDDPTATVGEVAEVLPDDSDWHQQGYYEVLKNYPCVIKRRISEKGSIESWSESYDYVADKLDECTGEIALSASGNPDPDPDGGSQVNGDGFDDGDGDDSDGGELDKRLRAVESKVESLRHELEQLEQPEQTNSQNDLAQLVIESLSDEQLGKILRGAMTDE